MNLNSMTVEQLKALCKERNITGYSAPLRDGGKAGLVKFIEQALNVVESVQVPDQDEDEDDVPGAERVEAGGVEVEEEPILVVLGEHEYSLSKPCELESVRFACGCEGTFFQETDIYCKQHVDLNRRRRCDKHRDSSIVAVPTQLSRKGQFAWETPLEPVVSIDGGVEGPVVSIDGGVEDDADGWPSEQRFHQLAEESEKLGEKILSEARSSNRHNGIKQAVQVLNKLNARQLSKGKPAGEATRANLRNGLNALIVEIHLAANRISPGIGQNAVLASTTTLLDFLRNDKKRIDFAARYAAALNLNNDSVEECLQIKNYLEANFSPIKCQFKKGQLPKFDFERIGGIEYIEDALDPLEFHLIVLAKCQTLWFCGYTHSINQESFWTSGDELSVSLKFAQLKILTKGETVREAFERK